MEKVAQWELHNLYSSPDIIWPIKSRRIQWSWHVACMGVGRNMYRVLVAKPEGKNHLKDQVVDGSMGSKWTFGRLVWWGVAWIHLAQDRDHWRALVYAVMNLQILVPYS
jgi:hypothetical protein